MEIEKVGFYLIVVGAVLLVAGWICLLAMAFHTRWYWGISCLLIPPVALLYVFKNFRKASPALAVLALGAIIGSLPYGYSIYQRHHIDLGPREKQVDGELHITLTGWDQSDYSILHQRPNTIVLQMANRDVDDYVLNNLRGMEQLRELDLNDTLITDEGLDVIASLPKLEELRLARTKITDEGFQRHLAGKESLKKLDLTGTAVKGKTKRDWKKAQQGRQYLD